MRRIPTVIPCVLVALFAPGILVAQAEEEVRRAVIAHYAAITAGDTEFVIDQHAGEFTGFLFGQGTLERFGSHEEQRQAWIEDAGELGADLAPRDIEVVVLDDVALALFFLDGSLTLPDGQTLTGSWGVTEVWVLAGDEWKELHHHDSPVEAEAGAEEEAIERITREWAAAYVAGDASRAASFLTEGATFVPPNAPAISGRAAIEEWSRGLLDQGTFDAIAVRVDDVRIAGDWALSLGSWAVDFSSGGATSADTTRNAVLWERQADGSWKAAHDIWNSALPLPDVP